MRNKAARLSIGIAGVALLMLPMALLAAYQVIPLGVAMLMNFAIGYGAMPMAVIWALDGPFNNRQQ